MCLFYPTDTESINLPKEITQIEGTLYLLEEPTLRTVRSPWTPEVYYENIKFSKKKSTPFNNTVKPVTENFQHIQTPSKQAPSPSELPTSKEAETAGPVTDSNTESYQKTPNLDSSEESYDALYSSVS